MLNTKVLNAIIIASIGLLFVALFINPPFQNNSGVASQPELTPYPTAHTTPLPSVINTQEVKSVPVVCNHPYFPLKKGVIQKYKLSVVNSSKKNSPAILFTNTVIDASGSSAIIQSSIQGEKTTSKQKILCKSNGIYGFPFLSAVLKSDAGTKKQKDEALEFRNIAEKVLLVPDVDSLTNKKKWNTNIKLENLSLPISLDVNGTTMTQNADTISYKQTVLPTFSGISLPNMGALITIETKVSKNVGIVQYVIKVTDKKETTSIILDLL